jgi:hypothetical protein
MSRPNSGIRVICNADHNIGNISNLKETLREC